MPVRAIVWGLLGALSLIVISPVRIPGAVGVKVMVMVQEVPGPTVLPQLLVWAKSEALVPVMEIVVMVNTALPVLVRVTV